jgi:hypothetical protein
MHRLMGLTHATLHHALCGLRPRLASAAGQGTVEYVGLLLLIGGVIAAVAAVKFDGKDVAGSIVNRLKESIDGVGKGK